MCNLAFLKVYNGIHAEKAQLHIPDEMEFPRRLKLLHWEAYPKKSLPLGLCLDNVVKFNMAYSKLEKLWEGTLVS